MVDSPVGDLRQMQDADWFIGKKGSSKKSRHMGATYGVVFKLNCIGKIFFYFIWTTVHYYIFSMSDFYNRDTQLSVLDSYLELGAYAMCLHHSPDELTGKELPKWYRVQVHYNIKE